MARIDGDGDWQGLGEGKERPSKVGLSKRRIAILGASLIAVIVIGIGIWWGSASSGVELTRSADEIDEPVDPEVIEDEVIVEGEGDDSSPAEGEGEVAEPVPTIAKVHVDGAVLVPGVYELYGEDPRVADAVAAAGGLTDDADTSAVNLAAQLEDADKVHIPRLEENATAVEGVGEIPSGSSTVSSGSPSSDGAADGGGSGSSGPVNINTAGAEELIALPGIGEKTAEKIVADREAQGPFASPEDLMRVSGIGEKKFAQIKDLICV